MTAATYSARRQALETYFDRTAIEAWAQLTSTAPVSKIRATVRAGRDQMRALLLSRLPHDMSGSRVLDAGCGTGAASYEIARRGAEVIAVDVSSGLIGIACQRLPHNIPDGAIDFRTGDMLDPQFGDIDHVVAMDSLIHYETTDIVAALARLAGRTSTSILFTVAPRTPALRLMHAVGRAFPSSNRAPSIVPVGLGDIVGRLESEPALTGWRVQRIGAIATGFYMSNALELVRT